jgi:hypothetical protein
VNTFGFGHDMPDKTAGMQRIDKLENNSPNRSKERNYNIDDANALNHERHVENLSTKFDIGMD